MDVSKESLEDVDESIEHEHVKKVEAALFISGRFLSMQELVALTDVNPLLLKKILEDLSEEYKDSGVEIVNKNNLWKMDVATEYLSMVNKLATGNSEFTKAEQETLAILAYKQPLKQSVMIKIRGNKAYDHIKKFVNMGLIQKKKMGHTAELSLSESFFDYFSLGSNESKELLIEPHFQTDEEATSSEQNTTFQEGSK
jgi:segregation and condensation protein B